MKNIVNYYRAYLNGRVFLCKKTGAIYESGGFMNYDRPLTTILRYIIAGFGPSIGTKDKLALSPGIGYSTFCIETYSDMEDFEYIGKI